MKNCDEMVNSLLERRGQYLKEQKKRKMMITRTMTSICCASIVGLLGFNVWQWEKSNTLPSETLDETPSIDETLGIEEINYDINENVFVINEVRSMMTADMDVQFSYYTDFETVELESVYIDFTSKIPDAFASKSFYSVDIPADAAREEYIPHDYVFEYQTENGGEVTIAICAIDEPLRDYFLVCDDPKQSEINGFPVVIYGCKGIFMVQFTYENINYDIETNHITQKELEYLLTGIMS